MPTPASQTTLYRNLNDQQTPIWLPMDHDPGDYADGVQQWLIDTYNGLHTVKGPGLFAVGDALIVCGKDEITLFTNEYRDPFKKLDYADPAMFDHISKFIEGHYDLQK